MQRFALLAMQICVNLKQARGCTKEAAQKHETATYGMEHRHPGTGDDG